MFDVTSAHKGRRQRPPRILVYGVEGIGKSTFADGFPNAIFISTEDGLDDVDCVSFPLCKSYDDVIGWLDALVYQKHSYQTVVIDTLDWLERLIWEKLKSDAKVDTIEKVDGGYGKGYVKALTLFGEVIGKLRRLRDDKNMIVVLTAHAKIENVNSLETDKFRRLAPKLHPSAQALVNEWVDLILLATRESGAAKGEKGGARIIRSEHTGISVGKSRPDIPATLPMDAKVLLAAIKKAQTTKTQRKTNNGENQEIADPDEGRTGSGEGASENGTGNGESENEGGDGTSESDD